MNIVSLEDVLASLESGARPSGGVSADSGEIPSLGGEHLTSEGCFNFTNIKRIPRAFFETMRGGRIAERDILVVKDGATTGKTSFVGVDFPFPEAAVNEHVFLLRVDQSTASPEYVYHFLRSPIGQKAIALDFRGATVGGISRGFAKKVRLPLPPLPEQRRIAEILDRADALRAKRRAALAELDALTQSIFLDMFGDPATNPKGWQEVELGAHTSKIGSGATPLGGEAAYKNAGIALIRSMNVRNGRFMYDGLAFIDEHQAARLDGVVVEPDDVLLNITGASVARVCRAPHDVLPARVNQHVAIIRPTRGFNSRFLEQCLLLPSMKRRLLRIAGAGATREAITKNAIERLTVIQPPRNKQDLFADVIIACDGFEIAQDNHLNAVDDLFSSLQHRAFRGEV